MATQVGQGQTNAPTGLKMMVGGGGGSDAELEMNQPQREEMTQQQKEFIGNNILTIRTGQTGPFKTLMMALKEIILETNITFTKDGMKLINMDKSHTVVVFLDLPASQFEVYDCKKDQIVIGVNLMYLFKLINSIESNETLTMYIEKQDYNDGAISEMALKFDNLTNNQYTIHKIRLAEPDQEEEIYPDIKYSSVITFPSADFQKIIRTLSNISEEVEIISVGSELTYKCSSTFASTEIKRRESDGMAFLQKNVPGKVVSGTFSLKYLGFFIKCTNLCTQTEMYLDNRLPLVLQYAVANLGTLRLCLSPKGAGGST